MCVPMRAVAGALQSEGERTVVAVEELSVTPYQSLPYRFGGLVRACVRARAHARVSAFQSPRRLTPRFPT
jgi:hypothetical protein